MKRARFTEERIIGILRENEAGAQLNAAFGVSERRACSIIKADRKSVRYRSCRQPDTALREQLRALAVGQRRFGYRRLIVLLRREGEPSGKNGSAGSIGLTVRKPPLTSSRHRHAGADPGRGQAERPLVAGLCARPVRHGPRFRILDVVDDVTHECLAAISDTSISGRRVARELTALSLGGTDPP